MFLYEDSSDFGRTWRPDLVPHIVAWLDAITPESLKHLVRLRVSDIGGFAAVFCVGDSPEVVFEFDDVEGMAIRVPAAGWYILCEGIVPFEQQQLDVAIGNRSHAGGAP